MSDPGSVSHPPGLWPVPGEGVLARAGTLILLSSLDSGQFVDTLLDLLEQLAADGGDGRQLADQVAALVEADESAAIGSAGPSVLAFGAAGGGLAVTVSGGAWADVTTEHGTARIEAGQPGMLLRCLLRSPVSAVRGGLGAAGNGAPSTDRFSRLDAGTVRADGLSFFAGASLTGGFAASAGRAATPVAGAAPAVPAQVQQAQVQPAQPEPAQPELAQPEPAAEPEPEPVRSAPPPVAPEPVAMPPVAEPVVPPRSVPTEAYQPPPLPVPDPAAEHAGTELWQGPAADQVPPAGAQGLAGPAGGQAPEVSPFPPPGAEPFESVLLLDAAGGARRRSRRGRAGAAIQGQGPPARYQQLRRRRAHHPRGVLQERSLR